MIYIVVYLIVAALYSYMIFRNNPEKESIRTITQFMLGTTWVLHLGFTVLMYFYSLFGVNIYYLVTVGKEKEDDNI